MLNETLQEQWSQRWIFRLCFSCIFHTIFFISWIKQNQWRFWLYFSVHLRQLMFFVLPLLLFIIFNNKHNFKQKYLTTDRENATFFFSLEWRQKASFLKFNLTITWNRFVFIWNHFNFGDLVWHKRKWYRHRKTSFHSIPTRKRQRRRNGTKKIAKTWSRFSMWLRTKMKRSVAAYGWRCGVTMADNKVLEWNSEKCCRLRFINMNDF